MHKIINFFLVRSNLFIALASFGLVFIAYLFETIGGYESCPLCLFQRWCFLGMGAHFTLRREEGVQGNAKLTHALPLASVPHIRGVCGDKELELAGNIVGRHKAPIPMAFARFHLEDNPGRTSCPSRLCIPTLGLPCPRRSKATSSDHWKKQRRSRNRNMTPLTFHLSTLPNQFGEYSHPVQIVLAFHIKFLALTILTLTHFDFVSHSHSLVYQCQCHIAVYTVNLTPRNKSL